MKTITQNERDLILALVGEGLTTLPAGALEKDILITDLLRLLQQWSLSPCTLILFGGTSLTKGYRVIERMSEDIDFKVLVPSGCSRSARKQELRRLKQTLLNSFRDAGFVVPDTHVTARDEHSYIGFDLQYQSVFTPVASLRPDIKLELTAASLQSPPEKKIIKTLAEELTAQKPPDFGTDCLNLKETVAEKVVSFLRRTAQVHAGRNRAPADPRLVRHFYDIHAISRKYPDVLQHPPVTEFQAIVESDAQQFRSQFPEFADDPIAHMQRVLDNLSTAKIFEENSLLSG